MTAEGEMARREMPTASPKLSPTFAILNRLYSPKGVKRYSDTDRQVGTVIALRIDEGGCWPNLPYIAARVDKSERTVSRSIKKLSTGPHAVISRRRRGFAKGNIYEAVMTPEALREAQEGSRTNPDTQMSGMEPSIQDTQVSGMKDSIHDIAVSDHSGHPDVRSFMTPGCPEESHTESHTESHKRSATSRTASLSKENPFGEQIELLEKLRRKDLDEGKPEREWSWYKTEAARQLGKLRESPRSKASV